MCPILYPIFAQFFAQFLSALFIILVGLTVTLFSEKMLIILLLLYMVSCPTWSKNLGRYLLHTYLNKLESRVRESCYHIPSYLLMYQCTVGGVNQDRNMEPAGNKTTLIITSFKTIQTGKLMKFYPWWVKKRKQTFPNVLLVASQCWKYERLHVKSTSKISLTKQIPK